METLTISQPMTEADDRQLEQFAFEAFAKAHPHEAHAEWPDRFWEFFRRERPGVSRSEMDRLLKETE